MNKNYTVLLLCTVIVFFTDCGKTNPVSPTTTVPETPTNQTVKSKIQYSYESWDTIPSYLMEMLPKTEFSKSDSFGLIHFTITNKNTFDIMFRATGALIGFTNEAKKTFTVKAGKSTRIGLFPLLSTGVFSTLTELKAAQYKVFLEYEYEENFYTLIDETPTALLIAKDVIYWQYPDENTGEMIDLRFLIAGWVTPHVPEVDLLVRIAADYHPNKSLVGYQGIPDPDLGAIAGYQVGAIYYALKEQYAIAYINSPISYPNGTQRVKYPADAIRLASANCIDGAVLMASAIENIGLNPVIILIPGHAFVGWSTWGKDGLLDAVETTMIGNSDYATARNFALETIQKERENGNFDNGISLQIKIWEQREYGITPLQKKMTIAAHSAAEPVIPTCF
jgi:hypothetical protein